MCREMLSGLEYSKTDYILQGSIATCLECDGMFRDYLNQLNATVCR